MNDDDAYNVELQRGAVDALMATVREKASPRHAWQRLKTHVYICQRCGTGRRNAQDGRGYWFTTWHTPDGRQVRSERVPPCERGQLTDERLDWLHRQTFNSSSSAQSFPA